MLVRRKGRTEQVGLGDLFRKKAIQCGWLFYFVRDLVTRLALVGALVSAYSRACPLAALASNLDRCRFHHSDLVGAVCGPGRPCRTKFAAQGPLGRGHPRENGPAHFSGAHAHPIPDTPWKTAVPTFRPDASRHRREAFKRQAPACSMAFAIDQAGAVTPTPR